MSLIATRLKLNLNWQKLRRPAFLLSAPPGGKNCCIGFKASVTDLKA
jgi:hypothetical protein